MAASCDPADFARAALGWDRLRLEAEVERELVTAEALLRRAIVDKAQPPPGCRAYVSFLRRAAE